MTYTNNLTKSIFEILGDRNEFGYEIGRAHV